MLTAVEDSPARIYMIDPSQMDGDYYLATEELDVGVFMTPVLGFKATYAVVAYNYMLVLPDPAGQCPSLMMGMEISTPGITDTFGYPGHAMYKGAHFLIRDCHGNYTARLIRDESISPTPELVAVRTAWLSPFASDPPGTVYAGGFDASYVPVHNTAWMYRGVVK